MDTLAAQTLAGQVEAEMARAVNLHAPIHSAHESYAVILEELDEYWELVKINPKKLNETDRAIRLEKMCNELMQIAAMCLRSTADLNL
jgi:hypothetical protein